MAEAPEGEDVYRNEEQVRDDPAWRAQVSFIEMLEGRARRQENIRAAD
jgi:hypothetical protein